MVHYLLPGPLFVCYLVLTTYIEIKNKKNKQNLVDKKKHNEYDQILKLEAYKLIDFVYQLILFIFINDQKIYHFVG